MRWTQSQRTAQADEVVAIGGKALRRMDDKSNESSGAR